MENFKKIISDFASSMKKVDSTRPVYVSQRKNKNVYKPGIGPHTETATINLVVEELKKDKFYTKIEREIKYPNSRKSCDLKFNINNKILFSEVKMMRIMGDNNKANICLMLKSKISHWYCKCCNCTICFSNSN